MTEAHTVVKAADAADLLRYLPALAGVPVDDSLVLMLFRGTRTTGALRFDLPHALRAEHLRRWASTVVGTACRLDGITGVVAVVVTPDTFAPSGRPPGTDVLRAIARWARLVGLEVQGELCVAGDGWGSLRDPDLPRGGRPLSEVEPVRLDGARPLTTLPEPGRASAAAQDRFARQFAAWWLLPEGPGGTLHGVPLDAPGAAFGVPDERDPAMERYRFGVDQEQLTELIERMLDPHDDAGDVPCPCRALLAALAGRPGLPGLVLLQFALGHALGDRLWTAVSGGDPAAPEIDLIRRALIGDHRRPDADRLRAAIAAVAQAEALSPPAERAGVVAMLAWLYWASGGGSIAGALADRALAEDPRQELAQHVKALTDAGRLPGWAFSEDPAADPFAIPAA